MLARSQVRNCDTREVLENAVKVRLFKDLICRRERDEDNGLGKCSVKGQDKVECQEADKVNCDRTNVCTIP